MLILVEDLVVDDMILVMGKRIREVQVLNKGAMSGNIFWKQRSCSTSYDKPERAGDKRLVCGKDLAVFEVPGH